jgi:hypothetical protein
MFNMFKVLIGGGNLFARTLQAFKKSLSGMPLSIKQKNTRRMQICAQWDSSRFAGQRGEVKRECRHLLLIIVFYNIIFFLYKTSRI